MANLFGKNRLRELAQEVKTGDIQSYIDIVKTWHNDYHKGSLKVDKETSREQAYNQDFFIKILGYQEKPASPYSLEPKATTEKGQLPDAVLSYSDTEKDIKNIAAVVELKGAGIELDRPQRREGNMSPVQQGFKYKTQYRSCPFVVVSNFWEFRLYRDNLLDYEAWTLDDLVSEEDDYLLFKSWYVLLNKNSLTTSSGTSKTEELLSDIRIEQEEIGKKFYKVYKEARLELLRDIYKNNPQIKKDIDTGIEKAQKIIDRVVFACFAEDRGLLPDNTLQRVVKAAETSAFGGSLWNTLKGFFEAIDTGSEKLEIPHGYNGGLFKRDEVLNNLQISDKSLLAVLSLGSYNFDEDLSVTILGHIFEQSISDLEEIKNKVNESQNLETLSQGRRKKDGIFYTPDYIVRYIVDNSLGAYLREQEEKCKDECGLKGDITEENYEKREVKAYTKYQTVLQNVKVVDPACGSGAFLVYVFDYLLAENKRVASILGAGLFSGENYMKSILKNNIYGVDLNEESVEITKLSLWLKSAEKDKQLTTLDQNIKCGNSLISDPVIAGSKAFDWNKEFKDIFEKGGFDVVVGNPPYVNSKHINKIDRDYLWKSHEEVLQMDMDLYEIFIHKSTSHLLKNNGYIGFITPDSYFTNQAFEKLRRYLLKDITLINLVDFPYRFFPFEDVNTETAILIAQKIKKSSYAINVNIVKKSDVPAVPLNKHNPKKLEITSLKNDLVLYINIDSVSEKVLAVKEIITFDKLFKLSNRSSLDRKSRWPKTSKKQYEKCVFTEAEIRNDQELKEISARAILGDGILKYKVHGEEKYTNIVSAKGKKINEKTLGLIQEHKLIGQRITGQAKFRLVFTYDDLGLIPMPSVNSVNYLDEIDRDKKLKALLCVINSNLYNYVYKSIFGESNTNITSDVFDTIPLKKEILDDPNLTIFSDLADKLLENNKLLINELYKFKTLITSEVDIEQWPVKLNEWWKFDFNFFANSLRLNLVQKDTILPFWQKYKTSFEEIYQNTTKADHDINTIIYSLYGLTSEEIKSIEST